MKFLTLTKGLNPYSEDCYPGPGLYLVQQSNDDGPAEEAYDWLYITQVTDEKYSPITRELVCRADCTIGKVFVDWVRGLEEAEFNRALEGPKVVELRQPDGRMFTKRDVIEFLAAAAGTIYE